VSAPAIVVDLAGDLDAYDRVFQVETSTINQLSVISQNMASSASFVAAMAGIFQVNKSPQNAVFTTLLTDPSTMKTSIFTKKRLYVKASLLLVCRGGAFARIRHGRQDKKTYKETRINQYRLFTECRFLQFPISTEIYRQ
jgi:hypothetical protein